MTDFKALYDEWLSASKQHSIERDAWRNGGWQSGDSTQIDKWHKIAREAEFKYYKAKIGRHVDALATM